MSEDDKDASTPGSDQEGKENPSQWFTEGYIGEVELNLTSPSECTFTIDPIAPFKVECLDETFTLLTAEVVKTQREQTEHAATSETKPDHKPIGAKLARLSQEVSVDDKACHGIRSWFTGLKERHQKIRFGLTEESEMFKLVKITLI